MAQNLQDLYNWIDTHTLTRAKRNLNRDFSDAVPVAEILKEYYPKLVDIHNYASRNSVLKKIDNWVTLHRKVLNKLNISLTPPDMEKLANAQPGAIESLMFKIKEKIDEKIKSEAIADGKMGKKRKPGVVPTELFEKQSLELDVKNQAIEVLDQKVKHMQNLLVLKDQRIKELTAKVDEYVTKENSGFFNIFS